MLAFLDFLTPDVLVLGFCTQIVRHFIKSESSFQIEISLTPVFDDCIKLIAGFDFSTWSDLVLVWVGLYSIF
jgi:hypothetical protein